MSNRRGPNLHQDGVAERELQAAPAVLMVRPTAFASNPETRASNAFQRGAEHSTDLTARAQAEFDAVAGALRDAGVRVHVFEGRRERDCPDEIFPNNWVSLHTDGTAVLYPLLAPNRRRERRPELLDALVEQHGYRISRTIDLTSHETHGHYLEGTGSLVLDRPNRIAYACRSPRTHEAALEDFAQQLGYEAILFDALDECGQPVYHTNVVMSVGTRFAVLCAETIPDISIRRRVVARLSASGREVIEISLAQMQGFAANLLELEGAAGPTIVLSSQAHNALTDTQAATLAARGRLLVCDIATIETYGGGGIRCMLAEVRLPSRYRRVR